MDKFEFVKTVIDMDVETYVVPVATLKISEVHPSRPPLLAALSQDNVLNKVPNEFIDYTNIFLTDLAIKLPEYTGINKHAIELVEEN